MDSFCISFLRYSICQYLRVQIVLLGYFNLISSNLFFLYPQLSYPSFRSEYHCGNYRFSVLLHLHLHSWHHTTSLYSRQKYGKSVRKLPIQSMKPARYYYYTGFGVLATQGVHYSWGAITKILAFDQKKYRQAIFFICLRWECTNLERKNKAKHQLLGKLFFI